ncbi:hypothetical protein Gogos_006812 [Gossypium gossypioides]|uniref:Uncharacterized protein n=1 Tax=Gossypium gossypioides TaxID=34282 RepID=A0A7J9C6Y4_GOSGO|nr:hypothetical protein [Gossypium gossypioides]
MQNTEIFVEGDSGLTVITVQARESLSEDMGYLFVHGSISRTTKNAYTEMGNVVNPVGWCNSPILGQSNCLLRRIQMHGARSKSQDMRAIRQTTTRCGSSTISGS